MQHTRMQHMRKIKTLPNVTIPLLIDSLVISVYQLSAMLPVYTDCSQNRWTNLLNFSRWEGPRMI